MKREMVKVPGDFEALALAIERVTGVPWRIVAYELIRHEIYDLSDFVWEVRFLLEQGQVLAPSGRKRRTKKGR